MSRLTPFMAAAAIVGMGFALRRIEPTALSLPEPREQMRLSGIRDGKSAARAARDGIAGILPRNLTRSVGRSLILMGVGLFTIHLLDEIADDEGVKY